MRYFRQKQFALTADHLQEMTTYTVLAYPFRYVSRYSLREFFKTRPSARTGLEIRGMYRNVDGRVRCGPYPWTIYYINRELAIGCVQFDKKESKLIREWALRKVRA
jgi:hypothetical protein